MKDELFKLFIQERRSWQILLSRLVVGTRVLPSLTSNFCLAMIGASSGYTLVWFDPFSMRDGECEFSRASVMRVGMADAANAEDPRCAA